MDMEDSTLKDVVKEYIAITQKQQASWSGQLNLAPNLLSMALLQMCKKGLIRDFIFMAAGAAIGAVIGILIGNGVLAFFFAGFLGTLKSSISNLRAMFKDTSEGAESKTGWFFFSLALSLLIAPVWFIIKLIKRIKAFFWMRSIEKRLTKEIIPSAYRSVEQLGEYIRSI
jgi:hypothetical protein